MLNPASRFSLALCSRVVFLGVLLGMSSGSGFVGLRSPNAVWKKSGFFRPPFIVVFGFLGAWMAFKPLNFPPLASGRLCFRFFFSTPFM